MSMCMCAIMFSWFCGEYLNLILVNKFAQQIFLAFNTIDFHQSIDKTHQMCCIWNMEVFKMITLSCFLPVHIPAPSQKPSQSQSTKPVEMILEVSWEEHGCRWTSMSEKTLSAPHTKHKRFAQGAMRTSRLEGQFSSCWNCEPTRQHESQNTKMVSVMVTFRPFHFSLFQMPDGWIQPLEMKMFCSWLPPASARRMTSNRHQ